MSDDVRQIFVRNDKGKTWGPLTVGTIELLVDNGLIDGKLQVSEDGLKYADPGKFPHLRAAFPKELWGETAPGPTIELAAAPVPVVQSADGSMAPAAPPVVGAQTNSTVPGGPVLRAGPGAAPSAGPVRAGPGAPPAGGPGGVRAGPGATAPGAVRAGPGTAPGAGPGAVQGAGAVRAGPGAAPGAGPGAVRAGPGANRPAPPRVGPPVMTPGPMPAVGGAPGNPPVMTPGPMPAVGGAAKSATPMGGTAAVPTAPASAPAPIELTPEGAPPPASGDLGKHSPIHLYYLAASGDQTGLLTFQLSDRTIAVHFRKGNPEHVSSSHAEDSVPGFLLKTGQASAEQIGKAETEKDKFGGELIPALFGLGILNPGTAFAQLAQHATNTLMKGLIAESGTFTWEQKDLPPQKAMPLGNRWAILSEFMRRVPMPVIRRKLQDSFDHPIMKSGGRVAMQDLRLSPQETRALGFIDGVRSLVQLAADLPQDADNFMRVAFLLKDLDMVSFASVKVAPRAAAAPPPPGPTPTPVPTSAQAVAAVKPGVASPTPIPGAAQATRPGGPAPGTPQAAKPGAPAAAKPAGPPQAVARPIPAPAAPASAPAKPAAPAAAPKDPAAELEELRKLVEKLKDQTLFDVLGIKQEADSSAVKVAYFKLAKAHHPDTVPQNAPPELAKLKADYFAVVGEAYRRLGDDKSRAEYIEELKSGGGEQVDVQAILMAEELFQKGQIMVKAKKFADAVKMLDDAIKANAEEGEFYAWRGIAKFFSIPDKTAGLNEAMKDIQLALKKNPRCAQAYYHQGVMAKLSGDNSGAQKLFAKTVELQPNHVDAQRELRMNKK